MSEEAPVSSNGRRFPRMAGPAGLGRFPRFRVFAPKGPWRDPDCAVDFQV